MANSERQPTSSSPVTKQEASRTSFLMLGNFNFFVYGTIAILMPFLPIYFEANGFNNVQIGLLMAVGPIMSIVANPFWGYWSDRLQNLRFILIIMLCGNLILSQVAFQMNVFVTVFTFMLGFFFFQSALFPISNSMILHAIENTRFHFGTFRLWGSLGFAVMAIVAGPIIEWVGISNLGYIYAVFLAFTILLCVGLPRGGQGRRSTFSVRDFSKIFANRYFTVFLILSVLISVPNMLNTYFMALYMSEMGATEFHIGLAWFIAALLEVPVFLLLDRFMKQRSHFMVGLLAIICALFAIRWLLMSIVGGPWEIIAVQFLHSITFGGYFYVGTMLCSHLIPIQYRASGQGIYAIVWMGISGIIAGISGGTIVDLVGEQGMYIGGMIVSAFVCIAFAIMWVRLKREHHKPAPSNSASA